jgi:hypothetical protein
MMGRTVPHVISSDPNAHTNNEGVQKLFGR